MPYKHSKLNYLIEPFGFWITTTKQKLDVFLSQSSELYCYRDPEWLPQPCGVFFLGILEGAVVHVPVKRRVASSHSQLLLKSRANVACGILTKPAVVRSLEVGRSATQLLPLFFFFAQMGGGGGGGGMWGSVLWSLSFGNLFIFFQIWLAFEMCLGKKGARDARGGWEGLDLSSFSFCSPAIENSGFHSKLGSQELWSREAHRTDCLCFGLQVMKVCVCVCVCMRVHARVCHQ